MKKALENLSESAITLDKSELFYSNNKEAKKLIHLPYYKLEELKNKESKKVKPLPKVKKREDHNMPKNQKTSELKSKKKKVILKKNASDSINLDLDSDIEKKVLRKISGFSNDNNIVEAIFSEENLLNKNTKTVQKAEFDKEALLPSENNNSNTNKIISSNFNLNKSPNKNNNLKKAINQTKRNKVAFETEILPNINIDPIKENKTDSTKTQSLKITQSNLKNKNQTTSTTPNTINPKNTSNSNNNNNSLNTSNFNLSSLSKPLGRGDRLKNLKYAEDEIKIKKSRLSRKQRRLQEAENTLASFLSKEDKFNLFNNDEGFNRLNSNLSVNSKNNNYNYSSNNNNNLINLHFTNSNNNFNNQNSLNNYNNNNNNSNNVNNIDGSILNQTNYFNNNQLNQTSVQQNNKNDFSVLGRKKKRISLCKKAVYKYRFKKKQFLVTNIFNFEHKEELPDNEKKKKELETIKEIENENAENIINENNQNLPLSENTLNKLDLKVETGNEEKNEISKKLELEKNAIKIMLNANSVNKIYDKAPKKENLDDNHSNHGNGDKNQQVNLTLNSSGVDITKNNNETKMLTCDSTYNFNNQNDSVQSKNNNDKQNISIINNNVFNYYNFNGDKNHKKDEHNNNQRKQNYKLKNNYYRNDNHFNQFNYQYPYFFNNLNPFVNPNFNNSFHPNPFPYPNSAEELRYLNTIYNNKLPVSGPEANINSNTLDKDGNNICSNPFYFEQNTGFYDNTINYNPFVFYSAFNISQNMYNNYKTKNKSYNLSSEKRDNFNKHPKQELNNIITDDKLPQFIFENSNYNVNTNHDKRKNENINDINKNKNSNHKIESLSKNKKKNKSKSKNKSKDNTISQTLNQEVPITINPLFNQTSQNTESSGFLFETALDKPMASKEKIDEEYKRFLESTYKLETDLTNLNGKEFNDYLKENKELKRLNYKSIQKFSNAEVVQEFVEKFEGLLPGTNVGKKFIREYVDQILDKAFDKKFSDFIVKLREIYYKKKQTKPSKAKKRFVAGFREVFKKIKLGDAKVVFIVPNIEKIEGKNGLDEKLLEIFKACKDRNVPIFFGLNKFKLGQISRKKHSCISILSIINVEGFEHELEDLINCGMQFKNKFYEKFADKKSLFLDNKFVDIDKFK